VTGMTFGPAALILAEHTISQALDIYRKFISGHKAKTQGPTVLVITLVPSQSIPT